MGTDCQCCPAGIIHFLLADHRDWAWLCLYSGATYDCPTLGRRIRRGYSTVVLGGPL